MPLVDGPKTSLRGLLFAIPIVWLTLVAASCGEDALPAPSAAPPTPTAAPTPKPCFTPQAVADDFATKVTLTTSADGLQSGDIRVGCGATVKQGDHVSVQYTGWLANGTVFDSSRKPGTNPFSVDVGTGGVIKGWDEGLIGMKVGGKRRLVIPPTLAYGAQGQGAIPPNATLTFDIEVLSDG